MYQDVSRLCQDVSRFTRGIILDKFSGFDPYHCQSAPMNKEDIEQLRRSAQRHMLCANIRLLRKMHNVSQQQLADALGVARLTIIRIERGESVPDFLQACHIADMFNVSVAALRNDLSATQQGDS